MKVSNAKYCGRQTQSSVQNWECNEHQDRFQCPDALISFDASSNLYEIIIPLGDHIIIT
jgi:hypothetical protein